MRLDYAIVAEDFLGMGIATGSAATPTADTALKEPQSLSSGQPPSSSVDWSGQALRAFAWGALMLMAAFLLNNYLIVWLEWPSLADAWSAVFGAETLTWRHALTPGVALAALGLAAVVTHRRARQSLRADAATLHRINLFIVRAAFWAALLIGLHHFAASSKQAAHSR